jgi:RHS repeat-associated protein
VNTSYTYDPLSRLSSVLHQAGSSTLDGTDYAYDAAGNRTSKTALPSNVASAYTYDPVYELTKVLQGTTTKESYTYDAVGNRTHQPGAPYTYNSSNEMLTREGVPYTYDADGNTLSKTNGSGTTSYAWDFENRLTSVTLPGTGGTVSFKYDPFGRRIQKTSPSGVTAYVYDGQNIEEELTGSTGTLTERYTYGPSTDEPLVGQRQPKIFFYEADGLGSVTSLTDPTGAVAATYTYDSFGFLTNSTGSATNWLRYTARQFDSDTALYYNRARYYDPQTGRFVSEDPIRFAAGTNFYSYVSNNPVGYRDPSGLCPPANEPTFTKRYLPPNAQTCSALLQFHAPPGFDLNQIVAAGRAGGLSHAGSAVGHYGTFDFQRSRDSAGNTTFYSGYTPVSNIAVGAYLYGAGYSRADAILVPNAFAYTMSSNAGDPQQASYWALGYDLAAAGWNPSCTIP